MSDAAIESLNQLFCGRCGRQALACLHIWSCEGGVSLVTDPKHAIRISARYEFGKLFNPDHDTTSYTDGGSASRDNGGTCRSPHAPNPAGREISTGVDMTPDRAELLLP